MLAYVRGGVGKNYDEYVYCTLMDTDCQGSGSEHYLTEAEAMAALLEQYPAAEIVTEEVLLAEIHRRVAQTTMERLAIREEIKLVEQRLKELYKYKTTYRS